jgi:deoxyribonuclease V
VCVDVDYRVDCVVAACVGFDDWLSAEPSFERASRSAGAPAGYEPGLLYRREMPYLLALMELLDAPPDLVIVDGFVWLDEGKPGLGAHLHDALSRRSAVIGVAKRPFRNATNAVPVLRGGSQQPLYVSSVGIDPAVAVQAIRQMHGPHRLPTLLKRVDRLSRT